MDKVNTDHAIFINMKNQENIWIAAKKRFL